jgi:DNA-binding XRE family transcriptional regulator
MDHQKRGNYLRAQRKKAGLSQREIGKLLGYRDPGTVVCHEQARTIPPLRTALAYELIFGVPVSAIFIGIHTSVTREVEERLSHFEGELGNRDARGRDANRTAQKLIWLNERRNK